MFFVLSVGQQVLEKEEMCCVIRLSALYKMDEFASTSFVCLDLRIKKYLISEFFSPGQCDFFSLSKTAVENQYEQTRVSGIRRPRETTNLLVIYHKLS